MIIEQIKDKQNLILVLLLYLCLSAILFSNFKYIINSDGIAYISIAKSYLSGNISHAINGYWGPLYSWLLMPFIAIWPGNLENVISTKILAIIIGLFTLIGIYLILNQLKFNNLLKTIILLALIPFMFYFTFNYITPDLLVVCLLLFYLNFLMDEKYRKSKYMGLITGLLGALAFLSKSYVFFFFLIHFILTNLYYIKKFPVDGSTVKKNLLLGLSVFLIISGIWAVIISEKYGVVTIGTTGSYNYALVGPESNGHANYYQGILKPPNESSVSSWEDPSYFQVKNWNPIKSSQNFNHQIMLILNNIRDIILISFNLLFIPLLASILALFLLFKTRERSTKHNIIFILGTMILYTGGYVLILIEERYLWFVFILSFLLGFYSLKMLYEEDYIKNNFFKSIIIVLAILLAVYPILALGSYTGESFRVYEVSIDLKYHGINGNIASNDHWEVMDYFSYYLDSKYYGVTKKQSDLELKEDLMYNQIDYYFIWGESPPDSLGDIVYENKYFRVVQLSDN